VTDLLAPIGAAIAVFAATNVDDLFVLAAFFADARFRARTIVFGQMLGIGVLVAASAGLAAAALTVPEGWPALLGLVPLGLGLWKFALLAHEPRRVVDGDLPADERRTVRWKTLAVAGVTIANGGDNLAVYVPLFVREPSLVPLNAVVFALMTLVWCWFGSALLRLPHLGSVLIRLSHVVLPTVLVLLGLWILADARVLFAANIPG
jgi:cadmium resistance protein CadD (predicted permease)